jgi:hypothetical protein
VQHDDGVLAAGEQQDRTFELGGNLADHVHRFRFELGEIVRGGQGQLHICDFPMSCVRARGDRGDDTVRERLEADPVGVQMHVGMFGRS